MKKILATVLLLLCAAAMYAQEQPASDSAAVEKPKYWNTSLLTQLGFSQVSLIDWAAGGFGSVSLNSYLDFKANYAKNKSIWENRAQFGYGFIQNMGEGFKKSDDRIIIDSKYGYKAAEKLYFSVIYNFRHRLQGQEGQPHCLQLLLSCIHLSRFRYQLHPYA